jgi:hypothetical protein
LKKNIPLGFAILLAITLTLPSAVCRAETQHVENSAKPLHGNKTIELDPLWTIGGDDTEVLLGTIERVLTLENGGVLLMDSQLSHIIECSADGSIVGQLGHGGSGPGELTNPADLVRLEDGTLGLVKLFPGQLVLLNRDGTPAGTIAPSTEDAPGSFVTLHRAIQNGGTLMLGGSIMTMNPSTPMQSRTFFLGRFNRSGEKTAEFVRKEVSFNMRGGELREEWQEFVWARTDVCDDGSVVVNIPRNEFKLSWFAPDGALLRTASIPASPWSRNKLAHDRMHAILDRQTEHMPPGIEPVVSDTEPVVVDLSLRNGSELWCLTAKSMWEAKSGTFATYDVIDESGRYVRAVEVICPGDATRDRLLFSKDRVYRVSGYWDAVYRTSNTDADETAEPMSVTCYRIK